MRKLVNSQLELLLMSIDGRGNGVGISGPELAGVHTAVEQIRRLVKQADVVLVNSSLLRKAADVIDAQKRDVKEWPAAKA